MSLVYQERIGQVQQNDHFPQINDEALVVAALLGDLDAFDELVRRFRGAVTLIAEQALGRRDGAEDVAQEAFLRAFRHASAYDARKGSVPTWLLTITRNLAVDSLRLRRPQPLDPSLFAGLEVEATGHGATPAATAETRTRWTGCATPSGRCRSRNDAPCCWPPSAGGPPPR